MFFSNMRIAQLQIFYTSSLQFNRPFSIYRLHFLFTSIELFVSNANKEIYPLQIPYLSKILDMGHK